MRPRPLYRAPRAPLLAYAAVGAETLPPWLPRAAPGESVGFVGNGYAISVGMSGAVALLGDQNAKNRHLDAQCASGSQGNPYLPDTELALQAIGARAATQAAMMLPDTAAPLASKREQASLRIRDASWGEM